MAKIQSSTTTRKPSYWTILESEAELRKTSRAKVDLLFREYVEEAAHESSFPRTLEAFVEDFWTYGLWTLNPMGRSLSPATSGKIEGLIEILRDEDWARITDQNPITA